MSAMSRPRFLFLTIEQTPACRHPPTMRPPIHMSALHPLPYTRLSRLLFANRLPRPPPQPPPILSKPTINPDPTKDRHCHPTSPTANYSLNSVILEPSRPSSTTWIHPWLIRVTCKKPRHHADVVLVNHCPEGYGGPPVADTAGSFGCCSPQTTPGSQVRIVAPLSTKECCRRRRRRHLAILVKRPFE